MSEGITVLLGEFQSLSFKPAAQMFSLPSSGLSSHTVDQTSCISWQNGTCDQRTLKLHALIFFNKGFTLSPNFPFLLAPMAELGDTYTTHHNARNLRVTSGEGAIPPTGLAEQRSTTKVLFFPFSFLSNVSSQKKKKKKRQISL